MILVRRLARLVVLGFLLATLATGQTSTPPAPVPEPTPAIPPVAPTPTPALAPLTDEKLNESERELAQVLEWTGESLAAVESALGLRDPRDGAPDRRRSPPPKPDQRQRRPGE